MPNHDIEFTRRKFTIPERLDTVLIKLADQHYQGNVSLCIRAAIEDHRSTLEGNSQESLAIQRLGTRLDDITSRQSELQRAVEDLSEHTDSTDHTTERFFEHTGSLSESEHRVYHALKKGDDGLRFSDLTDRVDLPPSPIQTALGALVDHGRVIAHGTNTTRFYLTGDQLTSDQ